MKISKSSTSKRKRYNDVDSEDSDEPASKYRITPCDQVSLKILKAVPVMTSYTRDGKGRRGALDVGLLSGKIMIEALTNVLEKTLQASDSTDSSSVSKDKSLKDTTP